MITYVEGGFFTSPAQTLVNTVNTVGVMGKGLAKEFRDLYLDMFAAYKARCEAGEFSPGALQLWRTPHKWVLNLPTKRHWRQKSRPDDIEAALRTFAATHASNGIASVAFPQLGCGNGGLEWERQVRPLMKRYLDPLPITVYVHVADGAPLIPEGGDGGRLRDWLLGEPAATSFAALWSALEVAAVETNAWAVAEDGEALHYTVAEPVEVAKDDLFDLWRALHSTGYASRDDLSPWLAVPADALLDLLERTEGLAPARIVLSMSLDGYDGRSTADLLADPAARAVRLLPMVAPAAVVPAAIEGAAPCPANATTTPLQLSLTA